MKTTFLILILFLFSFSIFAQDVEALFQEGEALYGQEKLQEAIDAYTKAIEKDSIHFNSYLRRGFTYSRIEEYEKAIADFSKILEMKPEHSWAIISRGSAYSKIKQYNLAIKDFSKVLQLDPKNQEAYNNRGWAKKFSGDKDGACVDWKKSKKMGNSEAKIILKNNKCK